MGLDMYAARKVHVKQWDRQSPDERYTVQVARGDKPVPGIQSDRISVIEEDVMYWRKANHIHAWFVDNVQGGEDDQREYCVRWDQLNELMLVCRRVIEASKLVDGTVDGGTVYSKEHPNGLMQRIAGKVIQDDAVARELLPTRSGFFFGNTEYDEYYLDNVMQTHDWAASMLADYADGVPGDIYYSSSW